MSKNDIRTAQILTYLGALPFLLLGMAVVIKMTGCAFDLALRSYGALIISFLCGTHWAISLFFADRYRRQLLLHSNLVTLIAWSTVLFSFHGLNYIIQISCFIYLFWLDRELFNLQILPGWYFYLRRNVTVVVSLLLIGTFFMS